LAYNTGIFIYFCTLLIKKLHILKKISYLFAFSFLFLTNGLISQTLIEREKIIANYDLEKLTELETAYNEKFAEEMHKALELAAIYGWEEFIELPNGGSKVLVGVFEDGSPKYYKTHNREGGITTRANKVHTGGGAGLDINGENMIVGEWDGGRVRGTHPLLENRVTQMDNPSSFSDHSTHVAGTMIGTGDVQGGAAKGMAPEAEILAWSFSGDAGEMTAAAANGLLVSNHSYGYDINDLDLWFLGYYDSSSRNVDNITYNAPYYLPVFSAGNDRQSGANSGDGGYDYLSDRGCAKNNIVVAATFEVLNYSGPGSVNMSSFSSWGPTDDGRIKPDISAKGVAMYSSIGASSYASFNGTSMASPNATGSILLLQQHFNDLNNEYMLSSTLRGLALHTADEAGSNPGPDYRFGWGLLNIERAAEVISGRGTTSVILEEELKNEEVYTFSVQSDGINDLMVSITWTDPSASPLPGGPENEDDSTPMLVNDLDLRVSQDGGATFFPWKLDPADYSAAATNGDNVVDNIEKIEIIGASGEYIIQVSHKNRVLVDDKQVFSLIVTGIDKEEFTVSTNEGIKEACLSDGSVSLDIDLDFNDGFSDTIDFSVIDLPSGTTGSFTPSSLDVPGKVILTINNIGSLTPGDYRIKVIAEGSSETINTYISLRLLDSDVAEVNLIYPADTEIDLPQIIYFTWDEGDVNVANYDFELSRFSDFSVLEFSGNVSLPTFRVIGVTIGAEYFWRVKPNTICAEGEYSEVFSFTVEGVLGLENQLIEGLVLYPNPAINILNIIATTPISSIEIFTVLGQKIYSQSESSNNIQIDISAFSRGTYFVRIESEGNSVVKNIVKQ